MSGSAPASQQAWSQYFSMMPDYRVNVEEAYRSEDRMALIGTATGTYGPDGHLQAAHRFSVPAAWRAVVSGDRVAVWQVFVNPEPILAAMRNA